MKNTWKIYMLALITFMVSTSEYVIAGILDKVAASNNVSVSVAGQLITVFALANAFGSPLVVMATTKMNQRKLMMLSLALMVLGSVMTITLPGFGFLIVSRIILALGSGVFAIAAKTAAAKLAPPEKQAGAIGTVILGFSAAIIIGVPIGRVVATAYDWKLIFVGIGVLSLLAIFVIMRTIPATNNGVAVPLGKQLSYLKNPKILMGLGATFFWQLGYGVMYSYIAPFLLTVTSISGRELSGALFAFGIATLIGSKFGGFMTDRIGNPRTLVGGLVVHVIALVLLSTIASSSFVAIPLLMLWSFSAWSSGPGMQYNLVWLAPEASGIMLSLYGSFIQLGIAAAAGIGGIAVRSTSVHAVSWIGAVSVAIAAIIAAVSFSLSSKPRNYEKAI
ncbi:MFS transporter [Bacillus sp. ISL-40]|uniref:MFS transporter n=1 Tax=unclassified Bacillus (in: firmicutes) TaxID=185979 RepID=UPI001BECBB73|nr:MULTISPECIES: MFS transporter [unclassified Bacillus (in: firmicutes)]MBT2696111.1 MFS transporter [Bacillus sp. ISL-40]MBT2744059.1 MFS transporter [Bacillus sp. ISL-77]